MTKNFSFLAQAPNPKQAIKEKLGKQVGDLVQVTVQEDTEERVVEVPADFQQVLEAHPVMKANFENFSFTCKKEYVQWIQEAKRPETRQARIQKSITMISAGKKQGQ